MSLSLKSACHSNVVIIYTPRAPLICLYHFPISFTNLSLCYATSEMRINQHNHELCIVIVICCKLLYTTASWLLVNIVQVFMSYAEVTM